MDTLTDARAVLAPKRRVRPDTLMTESITFEPPRRRPSCWRLSRGRDDPVIEKRAGPRDERFVPQVPAVEDVFDHSHAGLP